MSRIVDRLIGLLAARIADELEDRQRELDARANAGYETLRDMMARLEAEGKLHPTAPVEPWHGKASGCS